jgi:hypothetical protein
VAPVCGILIVEMFSIGKKIKIPWEKFGIKILCEVAMFQIKSVNM